MFEVEKILDIKCENQKMSVLVKWEGFSDEENTWEPIQNLGRDCAIKLLNQLKLILRDQRKHAMAETAI